MDPDRRCWRAGGRDDLLMAYARRTRKTWQISDDQEWRQFRPEDTQFGLLWRWILSLPVGSCSKDSRGRSSCTQWVHKTRNIGVGSPENLIRLFSAKLCSSCLSIEPTFSCSHCFHMVMYDLFFMVLIYLFHLQKFCVSSPAQSQLKSVFLIACRLSLWVWKMFFRFIPRCV